ncbi:hypothetical protein ACFWHE_23970, partial [Streptomyces hydrogenans]
VVDGTAYAGAKAAAMRAHATQITVAEPLFVLSNEQAQPLFTVEYYERVAGPPGASARRRPSPCGPALPRRCTGSPRCTWGCRW